MSDICDPAVRTGAKPMATAVAVLDGAPVARRAAARLAPAAWMIALISVPVIPDSFLSIFAPARRLCRRDKGS